MWVEYVGVEHCNQIGGMLRLRVKDKKEKEFKKLQVCTWSPEERQGGHRI